MHVDRKHVPVLLLLVATSAPAVAQVNAVGRFNCSAYPPELRTGAAWQAAPIDSTLQISGIRDGKGAQTTKSAALAEPTKTNTNSWTITFSPDYKIELIGDVRRDGVTQARFEFRGVAPGPTATTATLTGAMLDGRGNSKVYRTCTYAMTLQNGTYADTALTTADIERIKQRKEADAAQRKAAQATEAERTKLAAEREKLAEERRQTDADKAAVAEEARRVQEEKNRIAADRAKTADEKKKAADRERIAVENAKRANEEAKRKKEEQDRLAAEQKRDAEQNRLAANQQTIQKQQASSDQRLGNVENFLGSIILPRTEKSNDWVLRAPTIPVQQQQFCRIIDKFHDDLAGVYRTRNEIKRNALYKDRQQDVAALLPNGAFDNWLVRLVEVTQAKDGSAAVMLQLPCRAMLGSDSCAKDASKPQATIAATTPAYRELQRIDSGNFVVVSGRMLFAAMDANGRALPSYATYQPGAHCAGIEGGKQQDVFTTDVRYLVQMR